MKLTRNEKRALKFLIENGRVSDAEMARKLRITSQAVGKIRRKLEEDGVIKGYSTQVDYKKLGINVFALAMFRIRPESWRTLTEADIRERVKGPHIVTFYRLPEGDVTHILVYGFRDLNDLDSYFHVLQTERGHISELRRLYVFSADSIVKENPKELVMKVIEEMGNEKPARPLPPPQDKSFMNRVPKKVHVDTTLG
ncbi:MAG: Lrp/AsnC family transcriptional regulator [Candidatus Altiarchaeota archaeon]|nr:Lrp/AsnC family transcriptional regulator [Candidatus Altiarchaeota archaeon]